MLENWDTLVVTLSNSTPEGKLNMDYVIDSLLIEESIRRERGLNNQFEANVAENKGSKNVKNHKARSSNKKGL